MEEDKDVVERGSELVRENPKLNIVAYHRQNVLLDDSVSEKNIRERLAALGIHAVDIRPIAASLEDVFVTLTAHEEEQKVVV